MTTTVWTIHVTVRTSPEMPGQYIASARLGELRAGAMEPSESLAVGAAVEKLAKIIKDPRWQNEPNP